MAYSSVTTGRRTPLAPPYPARAKPYQAAAPSCAGPPRCLSMSPLWLVVPGIVLTLLAAGGGAPLRAQDAAPVYAVWAHSDYQPWQADVYARDPSYVLRELDWMHDVGLNRYLPLAIASGRVNWPSERFPDTRALYGVQSP